MKNKKIILIFFFLLFNMNLLAKEKISVYDFKFIDIDNLSDLAKEYNVRSVPTVVIEENGKEVSRFVGSIPKSQVLDKLQ